MLSPSILRRLKKILGEDAVLHGPEDVMLYEYDAGLAHGTPGAVAFPQTREQVSELCRLASREGLALVPRGAGTGLSGGSVSREGGIVLVFSRMNRILELDIANQRALVQPGVVNLE